MAGARPTRRTPARNAPVVRGNGIPVANAARKGSFHATTIGNSPAIRNSSPLGEKYGLVAIPIINSTNLHLIGNILDLREVFKTSVFLSSNFNRRLCPRCSRRRAAGAGRTAAPVPDPVWRQGRWLQTQVDGGIEKGSRYPANFKLDPSDRAFVREEREWGDGPVMKWAIVNAFCVSPSQVFGRSMGRTKYTFQIHQLLVCVLGIGAEWQIQLNKRSICGRQYLTAAMTPAFDETHTFSPNLYFFRETPTEFQRAPLKPIAVPLQLAPHHYKVVCEKAF